jgi:hypothetical protein
LPGTAETFGDRESRSEVILMDSETADLLARIIEKSSELDNDFRVLIERCPKFANEIETVRFHKIVGPGYLDMLLQRIRDSKDEIDLGMDF